MIEAAVEHEKLFVSQLTYEFLLVEYFDIGNEEGNELKVKTLCLLNAVAWLNFLKTLS